MQLRRQSNSFCSHFINSRFAWNAQQHHIVVSPVNQLSASAAPICDKCRTRSTQFQPRSRSSTVPAMLRSHMRRFCDLDSACRDFTCTHKNGICAFHAQTRAHSTSLTPSFSSCVFALFSLASLLAAVVRTAGCFSNSSSTCSRQYQGARWTMIYACISDQLLRLIEFIKKIIHCTFSKSTTHGDSTTV